MQSIDYSSFIGLDVRQGSLLTNPRALRRATNVDLLPGGALVRRDALRLVATLSAHSVGLYSGGGALRAVVPGGQSLQSTHPAVVAYDPIGDGSAYALDSITRVHAVDYIGAPASGTAYPYAVIERSGGQIEHHWLTAQPISDATAVNTKVSLPFDPGKALIKANNKLFADDPANGVMRFCSSVNGPTDWTSRADAGYLAVRQYVSGDRQIVGFGYFKQYVAVLFSDAIELWLMNPDPAQMQLFTVLNGPGTKNATATVNVLGDMIYFSRGGFRSLSTVVVTGEVRELDVGAEIQDLTDLLNLDTIKPTALWSQGRSQYICAVGTDVWVLTNSPLLKLRGWTKWELPVSVDYMVELNNLLYIRSGNDVYQFDPAQVQDLGTTDVTYDVLTGFLTARVPASRKRWNFIDIMQSGLSNVNFHVDPANPTTALYTTPIATQDTTFMQGHIGVNTIAEALALRFTGKGAGYRLDGFTLQYDLLRGAGA